MATRSTIALEFADGTVGQVYCHWDGYLDNNGRILLEHYTDPFKVRELIDHGDLSSLRPEIGVKHPFSPWENNNPNNSKTMTLEEFKNLYDNMCTFYNRDRGESEVHARSFKNFQDYADNHQYEEFEYILRTDGTWYVSQYNTEYTPLAHAIKEEEMVGYKDY